MHPADRRKKLVAVVAHCTLNQNTVVKHLASHEGVVSDFVNALVKLGYGIVQLPCPEALYLGMRRWWMSKEQYDTQSYRKFSRKILEHYVALLKELVRDGCTYILVGVHGSPSCAVETTTSNPYWQGEPKVNAYPQSTKISGIGVFMEVFLEMIRSSGIPEPVLALDVDHREVAERGLRQDLLERLSSVSCKFTN
ncbi:MAG: hypothetical protein QXH02_01615 [Desulfurococcaceae archaeon]